MHANIRLGSSCILMLLILVVWAGGCQTRVASETEQFRMLSDGFELLLVDDLPTQIPIQQLDSTSLRNIYPSERSLSPGKVYAFKKIMKSSNETLGMRILPERLARIGAHVTKAPQSSKDFMYPFIGGALFVIEFDKDGHHGTIFNRVHMSPQPGERWEELIIAFK
jgi:hypothetical protein